MFPRFLLMLFYFQILQRVRGSFPSTVHPVVKDGKRSHDPIHIYMQQPPPTMNPYTYTPSHTTPFLFWITSTSKTTTAASNGLLTPTTQSTLSQLQEIGTTTGPPIPPTRDSGCQDNPSVNCSLYNSAVICDLQGTYYVWARKNCRLHCGFCHKVCRDDPDVNCNLFNPTALCSPDGGYHEWASIKCPAFCGLCPHETHTFLSTTKISSTEPLKACKDSLDCRVYNSTLICSKTSIYYPWSQLHCPSFCGFCHAPTRIVPCRDRLTNCDEYSSDLCINPLYRLWREENCRKYCGVCTGSDVEIDYSSVLG
uniref:Uncharacterized protein LOC111137753 isoform X1 n=1 Tax=Crassostrea virginica TaxID=6565 RepID=A0A8B8EYT2_CRAVI|nr:uncharacterized protein LOC111137753 isoform X1 [Crassostrea virginica]